MAAARAVGVALDGADDGLTVAVLVAEVTGALAAVAGWLAIRRA